MKNDLDLVETYLNNNYDTDKYDLGYLEHFYSPIFTPYKNDKIKILEIGVRYGGSIELWRDFFVNGDVYGIDNNDEHIAYPDGCNIILGDAYDNTFVEQFKKEYFDNNELIDYRKKTGEFIMTYRKMDNYLFISHKSVFSKLKKLFKVSDADIPLILFWYVTKILNMDVIKIVKYK